MTRPRSISTCFQIIFGTENAIELSSNVKEAEVEGFDEDLQDLLEITPQKLSCLIEGTRIPK